MAERDFQSLLIKGARAKGFHVVPIPDSGSQRFGVKKVYDLGLAKDGVYYACELKWTSNGRIPFNSLKEHQRKYLWEADKAGLQALVIAGFEKWEKQPNGRGKCVHRSAYALPLLMYDLLERKSKGKSGNLTFWQEHGIVIPRIKVEVERKHGPQMEWAWDPTPVHEALHG